MTDFRIHIGTQRTATGEVNEIYATGLYTVKITSDPKDPAGVHIALEGGHHWDYVKRGRYVLWPAGEVEKLIKVLKKLGGKSEQEGKSP